MEHQEIPEAEGVHGLLGTALDDVEFDGDVVPGVLSGYQRQVKVRRFQAVGGALAVLAVAAVGVSILPSGGGPATKPVPATSSPAPGSFRNEGCTQHWASSELDAPRESVFCEALTAVIRASAPGATFTPRFFTPSDLGKDPRIDQTLYAKYLAEIKSIGRKPTDMPAFDAAMTAEVQRLQAHPEDPLNTAQPNSYTLGTALGRATFDVKYATYVDSDLKAGDGTAQWATCAGVKAGSRGSDRCTPVAVGDWHGTVAYGDDDPTKTYLLQATLTDGRNHYFVLSSTGTEDQSWKFAGVPTGTPGPDGQTTYVDAKGQKSPTQTWTNVRTHEIVHGGDFAPRTPALTPAQFTALVSTPQFAAFLDKALPAYNDGWTK